MKKSFLALILAAGCAIPMACSNNSNPTSPATPTAVPTIWADYTPTNTGTPTSTATLTPTGTPTVTGTITPPPATGTPTNTYTATPSGTPTETTTFTPTPTPYAVNTPVFVSSIGSIQYPNGVAVNAAGTTLYVAEGADASVSQVQIFNGSSLVTTLTAYNSTKFGNPSGVAVNSAGTTLYVVDAINNAVYVFNASTRAPIATWSTYGSTSLDAPEGIAVDSSGNVYVADTGNDAVEEFTYNGGATIAQWTTGASGFFSPSAVALDGSNNLYVADSGNELVQIYNGSSWSSWPTVANSDVFGIAVDGSGNVYLADSGNSLVEEYSNSGNLLTQWNGSNSGNTFLSPDGLALAGTNIWVTDWNNGSNHTGTLTKFGP